MGAKVLLLADEVRGEIGYVFDLEVNETGVLYYVEINPGVVALLRREDFCILERGEEDDD